MKRVFATLLTVAVLAVQLPAGVRVISCGVAVPPVTVKVGSFTCPGTTGAYDVTGIGFTPQAVLFWGNAKTADGTSTTGGDAVMTILGASVGSGAGNSIAIIGTDDFTGGQVTLDSTYPIDVQQGSSTYRVRATVTGFSSGTISLSFANVTSGVIINYMAIGGLANAYLKSFNSPGTTGAQSQNITSVPFQPDAVILYGGATAANGGGLGFAASSSQQATLSSHYASGGRRYQRGDRAFAKISGATLQLQASLSTFNSDGFTLSWDTATVTSTPMWALCLKGGKYAAGAITQKTGTTGTQASSSLGLAPAGLLLMSTGKTTGTTIDSGGRYSWMTGGASSTTARSALFYGNDAESVTDIDRTKIYKQWTDAAPPVLQSAADLSAFGSDTFTLDFTTVDATAREILYFVIGN